MSTILDISYLLNSKASKSEGLKSLQTNKLISSNLVLSNPNITATLNLNTDASFNININNSKLLKFTDNKIISLVEHEINNCIVKSNLSVLTQLNAKNLKIEDTLFVNKIEPIDDILSNQVLKIYGRTIILGDQHSIIQIPGTTTYVHTTDIILEPKLLNINFNSDGIPNDIGFDSGILIGSNAPYRNSYGYIKTNISANAFLIKPPLGNPGIIPSLDLNNNLTISGNLIGQSLFITNRALLNDLDLFNNLNISGNTKMYGDMTVLASLNTQKIVVEDNLNVNGDIIVYNKANISGPVKIYDDLYVSGNVNLGTLQIYDNLNISGSAAIYNNLYVSGNVNLGTLQSNIMISNDDIFIYQYSSLSKIIKNINTSNINNNYNNYYNYYNTNLSYINYNIFPTFIY